MSDYNPTNESREWHESILRFLDGQQQLFNLNCRKEQEA